MDARAKAAKNPELVEAEFIYWIDYYDNNVAYAHTINTVDDYAAELKALIDVARAIHYYLLSPAGAHHNSYDILGFQCGIGLAYKQIVDALNAAPIPNKGRVFDSIEFDKIDKPLSTEWAWIKFHLDKLQKAAEVKEAEEDTLALVIASKPEQPVTIKPAAIEQKPLLRALFNFFLPESPAAQGLQPKRVIVGS